MRSLKAVVIILVIWVTVTHAHHASAIADETELVFAAISAAEEEFNAANKQAADTLIEAYKQEIKKQAAADSLDAVTRLIKALQLFQSDGLMLEPELHEAYKIYGNSLKAARDSLLNAYTEAMTQLAPNGDMTDVLDLQQRIRDKGLVSRLVSLRLARKPTNYLMHAYYKAVIGEVSTDLQPHATELQLNATFELVAGLTTSLRDRRNYSVSPLQGKVGEVVSFRSINIPRHYLAHSKHQLLLQRHEDSETFRNNASFKIVKGLSRSGISLEAVQYPNYFLVFNASAGTVVLRQYQPGREFADNATFNISTPKFPFW
ncbi:MAG: Alpha-L-arabinofuranosidase domain [Planctomycetota bacterium]